MGVPGQNREVTVGIDRAVYRRISETATRANVSFGAQVRLYLDQALTAETSTGIDTEVA